MSDIDNLNKKGIQKSPFCGTLDKYQNTIWMVPFIYSQQVFFLIHKLIFIYVIKYKYCFIFRLFYKWLA